ncbi:MAG: tRNA guanosine(34) transglycosylase Tgt [Bacteroidota bacterium]|nr:tRNA guanosine(34) transglycosylase Tgt [Bacteroidota bacterium]MDP4234394.1 tRNA guanosine(34) transglycosylase Tgt [Bacteroidota bacterium]MDP4243327.1 tRNA guanosine(34) transglycosylase Tgt [Bacteroidota bacterium]MDP4288012.1 tRNA guanosine(34) transglycosylase Tgt [Bacteroidota bacterium]
MQFTLEKTDSTTKARAGRVQTAHGEILTPAFMPVGTLGTVKALTAKDVWETGARMVLANAYHLYLRPGTEVIAEAGGIHRFAHWQGSVLTDSGGYQVFSLADLRKTTDDGVHFKSHLDGSAHYFTAEKVIEIERAIGADIIMPLDECPPSNARPDVIEQAVRRTIAWARRSMEHLAKTSGAHGYEQSLFPIVQGGTDRVMREACARELIDLSADGYAIGGLAVGEPNETMYQVTDWTTDVLPAEKPRYLMGVGTPVDLLESIARGVDMFDCVLPTRNARNGQIFTRRGKLNMRNAKWKKDFSPIDEETNSYASKNFSKAYLAHLINSNEILGLTLATMHNVAFYEQLVQEARVRILNGSFSDWLPEFRHLYLSNDENS